jgi:Lysylphosphatidylglycerol synthase TM region
LKPYLPYLKWILRYILGPLLFIWLSLSLWQQIKNQPNLIDSLGLIREAAIQHGVNTLLLILLFMFVNWGIEAWKWQLLLKGVDDMSWWRAFKATLTGVAFALNTPNRIGEYGGRVLYVKEGHRLEAASLTVVGSFSQIIVTLFMGTLGLIFLRDKFLLSPPDLPSFKIWLNALTWGAAFATVISILAYFRIGWMMRVLEQIPGYPRSLDFLRALDALDVRILLRVLVLSFYRYAVFVFQTILLMKLLLVSDSIWDVWWATGVMYLVMAMIPSVALLELGLRGEVSMVVFGLLSKNLVGILAASTGIWFINLVVPALAGSLLILGIKFMTPKK